MHSYAKALFYFMNWNEVICPSCGLVNDYTIEEKSNIEKYKKEYADYWKDIIGVDGDFDLKEEFEEDK